MRLYGPILTAALVACLGMTGAARADAPPLLPTQGLLLDNAGLPVSDGQYYVTFALYGAATGGSPLWSESWPPEGVDCATVGACVATQGGAFAILLGSHEPLQAAVFATTPQLWLGIKVEQDPELPRRRVATSAYAFRAMSAATADAAKTVACAGCIGPSALGFPTAGAVAAGGSAIHSLSTDDLSCTGCVSPGEVSFPYAAAATKGGAATGLECSGCVSIAELDDQAITALSMLYTDQMAIAAVAADGFMRKTDGVSTAQLPPDGLDEVSNGVLTTQFQSSYPTPNPVAIPDFAPPFPVATATVSVPSLGAAETLSIQVHIDHANVGQLVVKLKSPAGVELLLHDKTGAGTTTLFTTYPSPTLPVQGDLAQFLGTDIAGTWTLEVSDKVAGGTGTIQAFWVHLGVLSDDRVGVNGSLDVAGSLTVGGKAVTGGVPKLECTGSSQIVPGTIACPPGKLIVAVVRTRGNGTVDMGPDCIGNTSCTAGTGDTVHISCCSVSP